MTECDNNKIHISSNFLLSICRIIMLDILLLVPSLHCNISLHFTIFYDSVQHKVDVSTENTISVF